MKSNTYIRNIEKKQAEPAKTKNAKEHAGTGYTCGECCRGWWSEEKNVFGKRFMIYCEYARWAYSQRVQSNVVLGSSDACGYFLEGEKRQNEL